VARFQRGLNGTKDAITAMKSYLILANNRIHNDLAFLCTWDGVKALGLDYPSVWVPFIEVEPRREFIHGTLLGGVAAEEIHKGRLYSIGGHSTIKHGRYLKIYAPKHTLTGNMCSVRNHGTICQWFIPQVEWDFADNLVENPKYEGLISNPYCSEWIFSVVEDINGVEISRYRRS
jgi:hypothetical protein